MVTQETLSSLKEWIRDQLQLINGKTVVLGISGGADSTVMAKLLVESIGADNVVGVFIPNGVQPDIQDAYDAAREAGLTRTIEVNIEDAYAAIALRIPDFSCSDQAKTNLGPRLRMAVLYSIAQTLYNGRVCCTGNRSEATVGYCTLWGDLAGDFAPFATFTKTEVCEIGALLGMSDRLVKKAPADGLSGKTDEEKLGVTYKDIDGFIEWLDNGQPSNIDAAKKDVYLTIAGKYMASEFKRNIVKLPRFERT